MLSEARVALLLTALLCLSVSSLQAAVVDVKDFGAVGDGSTDDTSAIRAALAASKEVHFPSGVYVLTDGIELPDSAIITGDGSPVMGTFPLKDDDKRFLNPERLTELPGTTLLFRGRGTQSSTTGRSDDFDSYRYAIKTAAGLPYQISRLAVVMDVKVRDGKGRVTTPDNDQRADYDVGIAVDDSPGGRLKDVSVFGYWKKAGLCVVSRGEGSNPDYNTFYGCSFSGRYGVALLGSDTEDGKGLSGTQFYGCNLFSADHHSRRGKWGSGALFIDGKTFGKHADVNGHYFFGGCIRTYNNVAVRLDHASNILFSGVVFEVPSWNKPDPTADTTGKIVGTNNTRDVALVGCRMHDIGLRELATSMTDGQLTVVGTSQGVSVSSGDRSVRLHSTAVGDPIIQLATNPESINDGWTIRLDVSDEESFVLRHDNHRALKLTPDGQLVTQSLTSKTFSVGNPQKQVLRDGVIDANQSRIAVHCDDESRLIALHGGTEGAIALLEQSAASAAITIVNDDVGNVRVPSGFLLDHPNDRLMLMKSGDHWIEISRTDFSH